MSILVSLLLCIIFFMSGGVSSCIEVERQALLDVKANLTDPFGSLYGWGSEGEKTDCCKWRHVTCDDHTGHVIELDFFTVNLFGKISPSLQVLSQLQYLDLSLIDFQSNPLPNILGSLSNLQELYIFKANLSGPIPHQLANLSNLILLDLRFNYLQGSIPFSFGDLTSLNRLYLSNNQLGGVIPKSFGNYSSLDDLDLSQNQLGGAIPNSFGNCSSLTHLDLSRNLLNGTFPSFVGCSSLYTLSIAHNFFIGSMPDLTGCTSLNSLDLSSNNFSGNIPNSKLQLSNLENLVVSHNFFKGSLPNFMGCPSLSSLDMSSNQFSGNVPNSLGRLSNLVYLDFSSNSLEGVISEVHFLNLTILYYLDLSLNSLALDLRFHGEIPIQLKIIKLQSCKLGPRFPMWIETQKNIQYLDISNAGISDNIPTWFAGLSDVMTFLNLSSNEIKGVLPDMSNFGSSATRNFKFPGIDLSYNHFEGQVPLLPFSLVALNLAGNRFSGTLSFLCEIEEFLTFLDLSNNSFSGNMPDCLMKFQKKIVILSLSNNNLSGEIPSSLGILSNLEALNLRKNAFVGEVPTFLRNCTRLRFVDLGENKLSGVIPKWIGEELSELYVLDLGSNRLYGRLPSQLCWLHNLHVFDLSNNGLSGSIPKCFDNFTAMARRSFVDDLITSHTYSSTVSGPCRISSGYSCSPPNEEAQFLDSAWVTWKGTKRSFGKTGLQLLKSIDLSRNNLSGKLPYEITSLFELVSLNLSVNKLQGEVPKDMGRLKYLESLDLSRNKLSGHIPLSLAQISSLSYLDLSYNNLSGRIPTGTQLQSFDNTSYIGNPQLCGLPLTQMCGVPPAVEKKDVEEDDSWKSYYTGIGAGFAVGFFGICGALVLNDRCRYFFFASLSYMTDWMHVIMVVHFGKLKRYFRR